MTRDTLARYTALTRELGWPIGELKLGLYRRAVIAFDGSAVEATRRMNHAGVYGHLRSYWGVGRRGTL